MSEAAGERSVGTLYTIFVSFLEIYWLFEKKPVYFKMSCWKEASRDGTGDQQERKEKIGEKAGPVTRRRRDDWAENKCICRLESEKLKVVS